ncbi:WD40-repeat-containing domain protein [Geopyxis carbonaria]|nr:WD40-repeat-containing domain protein [Geopyxis carbonaria]
MASTTASFVAIGGNRHPAAADWSSSGTLAFGAGKTVALWNPDDPQLRGITATLKGHTEKVNAVRFLPDGETLISGSVDTTLRIWRGGALIATVEGAHTASINTIATCPQHPRLFASGAADGKVCVFSLSATNEVTTLHTIATKPKFYPLALALHGLPGSSEGVVLVVGGSTSGVVVYTAEAPAKEFKQQAVLQGHENWIRSLAFRTEGEDLLLASASQDRYVRLWRVHAGETLPAAVAKSESKAIAMATVLSNKAHMLRHEDGGVWSVTFEALLMGHEDWIYTAAWAGSRLLTCSADNSIIVWNQDEAGGAWDPQSRFGELSALKGGSMATGSAGGIWNTLWSPDGTAVAALTKSGSWRIWRYDAAADRWNPAPGISGHTKDVTGISWAPDGGYLLTTSLDQTTRLYAQWLGDGYSSWHEFSRPQIHGYDMNVLASVGANRFVSGADEKLLRVFDEPKAVAQALGRLCGLQKNLDSDTLLDTASLPVLGLSNKPLEPAPDADASEEADPDAPAPEQLPADMPPLENQLARLTLWPETEKLYGHGYEISALAASPTSALIATACKASTSEHAVIRLFDGDNAWHEVKPALEAHALTVTKLRFSGDGARLLSVGRDRAWCILAQSEGETGTWALVEKKDKAHTRIIYDCAWLPAADAVPVFATVSRDKSVKIWAPAAAGAAGWETAGTAKFAQPVTAVDVVPELVDGRCWMMLGFEDGALELWSVRAGEWAGMEKCLAVDAAITPAQTVAKITWRPRKTAEGGWEVGVASDDGSVRVYKVSLS